MDHVVEKIQEELGETARWSMAGLYARDPNLHNLSIKGEWTVLENVVHSGVVDTVALVGDGRVHSTW